MKKTLLLTISILAIGLLTGCTEIETKPNIMMTLTPKKGVVEFKLTGDCEMIIDWGDGPEKTTATLTNGNRPGRPDKFSHTYSDNAVRTISIFADTIKQFECYAHEITMLDVSNCPALIRLSCYNNQITSLDVSKNTNLQRIHCNTNNIESLNVSNNPLLQVLHCYENKIETLDLSKNPKITSVECHGNRMSAEALDAMFESINTEKNHAAQKLTVKNNPGSADCNIQIAIDKKWNVEM
jgi:hypothetical protein